MTKDHSTERPFDTSPPTAFDRPEPAEWGVTPDEARALLMRQVCPVCGEGPWKSPLNHVARKHGIDKITMRDVCGLTTLVSVVDPELRERCVERGRAVDMSTVNQPGRPRKKQRWTSAGRAAFTANIEAVNQTPEAASQRLAALAKARTPDARKRQGASLKARWDALTDDERRAKSEQLRRTPEELSEQATAAWDRRGRKPHGTRASYRRGCKCDECRAAYLAYRKSHG
jgi:hypothetical protein